MSKIEQELIHLEKKLRGIQLLRCNMEVVELNKEDLANIGFNSAVE